MFKSMVFTLVLGTLSTASAQVLVRINYANLDSYDIVQGECLNDVAGKESYSVTNTIKIKKVKGLTYNFVQKEQGYGACSWALAASDKNRNDMTDKLFSLLWGDMEVLPVGNQIACYRTVLNLTVIPGTVTVKEMAFKKLPVRCP